MPRLHFRFAAPVVRLESGVRPHLVPVPDAVAAALRAARVRRLICRCNGHELKRALQHHADGGSFLVLGRAALAAAGLRRGATATVELRPDPQPDTPDVPAEFTAVLAQDDAARARWETFTPGRRRSLLVYVAGAKQEATRVQRALELARKLRTHTLHGDQPRPAPLPASVRAHPR